MQKSALLPLGNNALFLFKLNCIYLFIAKYDPAAIIIPPAL